MATGPLPRRSKLSELIRSPFRSSTLKQEDNDWYIPYNGPIEPPRLSLPTTPAFDYSSSHRRDTSPIAPEAHQDPRIIGSLRDSSSSKRAQKARKLARKAVISLDTGGIGESPATVLDEQSSRRSSAANLFSSSHSHKDPCRSPPPPPAVPYVVSTSSPILTSAARHPFNSHGFDNNYPSSTNTPLKPSPLSPLITSTAIPPTTHFPPPSLHSSTDKHPYSTASANSFSRIEQVWPTLSVVNNTSSSRAATILSTGTVASVSDPSVLTGPLTSERSASEWGQHHSETFRHRNDSRRLEQHFTGSSGSTSVTSSAPRDRDHHHTLIKSRSTPQSLSASHYNYLNTNIPAYSMQTHPYALSPIPSSHSPTSPSGTPLGFNGKPPIPRKSFRVLQRLRATASAPNLQNDTTKQAAASHSHTKDPAHSYSREHKRPPRINITPPTGPAAHDGMAHELPITLAPASSMQAVAHPRPRFISAPVPPEDPIPSSPYPLSRPQFPEFDDTDGNMFAQCLPLPTPSSYRDRVKEVKDGKGSTPPANMAESPLSDAASFKSKDVEKTLDLHRGPPRDHEDDGSEDEADEEEKRAEIRRRRERDEALVQAVRDNQLLAAERERWEKHAHRSLGNKRSRSLSTRGKKTSIRRSASQGAIEYDVLIAASPRSGRATNGRHRATTVTSGDSALSSTRKGSSGGAVSGPPPADSARSRSATLDSVPGASASVSSLRYLASAAFGHTGHSAKVATDSVSGGRTSLLGPPSVTHSATQSNTAAGAAGLMSGGSVSRRSATSGSRSGSMSGSHSRGSSVDTRQIAVASIVRVSQVQPRQDYDIDVMDIRDDEDNSVRAAVEQRIGLALSPSPELMARSRSNTVLSATSAGGIQHPYAFPSASLSSRAGPHPTTASQTSSIPFKDDVATRHRLPPQVVHAHKRSLSTGNSASSIAPAVGAAASASRPPSRRGKASAPPATDISDHPFMASSETFLERPSSGRVEESFREALVASSVLSEWPGPLSAELRDGDPDPFRRNPVAVVPTTPPGTPRRGRTRSHGAASVPATPPRRQPSAQSTSRNQRPIPPPVATSTPLKRRSRSMSDIKTRILGRSTSSSENVCSRPVSPTRTFGPPDSPITSHAHAIQTNSPENYAGQTSGGVSPPTESSIVSIVNPEILLHEDRDDLEEFRDLFYRPSLAYSTESSPRESLRVDAGSSIGLRGRPLSGTSALWNSLGPVFSEHFEMESGNHVNVPHSIRSSEHRPSHGSSDRNRRSRLVDENDLVRLRSIDASTPSVLQGEQRHSSTPQIEEETPLSDSSLAQARPSSDSNNAGAAIPRRSIARGRRGSPEQQSLLVVDSPSLPGSHDNSSGEWNRFSHATEGSSRMSNIIRGFPTPPDVTSLAGTLGVGSHVVSEGGAVSPFSPFTLSAAAGDQEPSDAPGPEPEPESEPPS